MKPKCLFRIRLEERLQAGETPKEDRCYSCFGYKYTCDSFIDTAHLLNFYELFRQNQRTQVPPRENGGY